MPTTKTRVISDLVSLFKLQFGGMDFWLLSKKWKEQRYINTVHNILLTLELFEDSSLVEKLRGDFTVTGMLLFALQRTFGTIRYWRLSKAEKMMRYKIAAENICRLYNIVTQNKKAPIARG